MPITRCSVQMSPGTSRRSRISPLPGEGVHSKSRPAHRDPTECNRAWCVTAPLGKGGGDKRAKENMVNICHLNQSYKLGRHGNCVPQISLSEMLVHRVAEQQQAPGADIRSRSESTERHAVVRTAVLRPSPETLSGPLDRPRSTVNNRC